MNTFSEWQTREHVALAFFAPTSELRALRRIKQNSRTQIWVAFVRDLRDRVGGSCSLTDESECP